MILSTETIKENILLFDFQSERQLMIFFKHKNLDVLNLSSKSIFKNYNVSNFIKIKKVLLHNLLLSLSMIFNCIFRERPQPELIRL